MARMIREWAPAYRTQSAVVTWWRSLRHRDIGTGRPVKPTGDTRPGDLRYNIMVRLGNLGCPHDVDHLETEALRAHWHSHLEERA